MILWYTLETSEIRKANIVIAEANRESQLRYKRPIVGFGVYMNKDDPTDTRFFLKNLSNYPVAVQVNCNFRIDNEEIRDVWPEYAGLKYWNLQYRQEKEGHFNWLDLYAKWGILTEEKLKELKSLDPNYAVDELIKFFEISKSLSKPPQLTIDIEIFCRNDLGSSLFYPPDHYELDIYREAWIPTVTSDKPYWEFNEMPSGMND